MNYLGKLKGAVCTLLLCTFAFGVQATPVVVWSDDFDNEAETGASGTSILNWDGGTNWNVNNGSVDLVKSGEYSIACNSLEYCVDMDGSTSDAGNLISINIGPQDAGIYEFSYWLSGNQRSDQRDVTVALVKTVQSGSNIITKEKHVFNSTTNADWTMFTQTFALGGVTDPLRLQFNGRGSDNQGVLLDNITLTKVPEPMSIALLGLGLIGLGFGRKQLRT